MLTQPLLDKLVQLRLPAFRAALEELRAVLHPTQEFDPATAQRTFVVAASDLAEVTMLPQNMSPLEGKDAERMLKLMEAMDDCDDVQKVYTNADIPDDMVNAM